MKTYKAAAVSLAALAPASSTWAAPTSPSPKSPSLKSAASGEWAASVAGREAALSAEKLSRAGLSEAGYAFKKRVYLLHVERGTQSGRARIFDLPPSQLALIPGTGIKMRQDAAQALGRLLQAARADLARDLQAPAGSEEVEARRARARRVEKLDINNAYRSASLQFAIWNRNFLRYYQATASERRQAPGGEHGEAAAEILRDYVGVRVAAPGFSNHQSGIAVDFALALKPAPRQPAPATRLAASMEQGDPWRQSWFWLWLKARAGEFGFVEYEPEPWHWEFKPAAAPTPKNTARKP